MRRKSIDADRIPLRADQGYHVVVESPRGSGNKLKWDPELRAFKWSRPLALGVSYPFDWGFFPHTRAPDGDPLDAFVLTDAPTFPGVVIPCRPVAVLELEQNRKNKPGRERNDRVLVLPVKAPRGDAIRDLKDLSQRLRQEIEAFFLHTTLHSEKHARISGWGDAKAALASIRRAARQAG